MNDLELCKKFADLEGVSGVISDAIRKQSMRYMDFMSGPTTAITCPVVQSFDDIYNPITDLALNCAAIIKYRLKVEPEYDGEWYATRCDGGWSKRQASKTKDANLQRAVVTCILKSEGLL